MLEAALEQCEWKLCRDLLRFLRSISASDLDAAARTPPPNLSNAMAFPPAGPASLPPSKEGVVGLKRGRHSSKGNRIVTPTVVAEKTEAIQEKRYVVYLLTRHHISCVSCLRWSYVPLGKLFLDVSYLE